MLGHSEFEITPRRGRAPGLRQAHAAVAEAHRPAGSDRALQGASLAPTVYGNVLVGPTASDQHSKTSKATTEDGLPSLHAAAARILPALTSHDVTASYAGLRAASEHRDYQVSAFEPQRYVCVGAIRSTGLTASLSLAEQRPRCSREWVSSLEATEDGPRVSMPNIGELEPRPYQSASKIETDPEYGRVVCFCERVSSGEIRDALRGPIPPCDLDGVRRRTRATMGRCQGFFCGASVAARIEAATTQSTVVGEVS